MVSSALFAEATAPKLISGEMPDYSPYARSHNVQGVVVIEALVDEKGRVFAADIVESVHKDLDAAAVAAVSEWTFAPATVDGEAVMKVVRIPINFNLVDPMLESLRDHNTGIAANE